MNGFGSSRIVWSCTAIRAVLIASITPAFVFAQAGAWYATGNSYSAGVAPQTAETYWTPQRLLTAKPVDLQPVAGATPGPIGAQTPAEERAQPVRIGGAPPTTNVDPGDAKTLIPEAYLEPAALAMVMGVEPAGTIETQGTSSKGAYFTTYRVFPDSQTTVYPNSTVGKLFFSDPKTGANSVCSASVLRHRVVVTAGHCLAKPSLIATQRYFFTNFMFVPSYRNGVAPYGTWTPRTVWVANAWYTSNGSVPNAQDVGMMVMNDNSSRLRIGNVTGYLGYSTLQLARNHVTMLGYPGNLDSGQRMEINHAFTFGDGGNNTYQYGSGMRGGSSGGPWIMDYGVAPASSPVIPSGGNILVSVTSYGPTATEPKYQGASNLDSRFLSLLAAACGTATSGNCN